MATFVFDTHRAIQNLKEAGISETQAEAMVAMVGSALGEGVATKADVQRVEQIVERVEQKLEYEVRSLRSDLQAMEQRITLKLGGLMGSVQFCWGGRATPHRSTGVPAGFPQPPRGWGRSI